jgi:HSP20 family protein
MFLVKRNFNSDFFPSIPSIENLFSDNFLNQDSKSSYMTVPRANVIKNENGYSIELAAPGFTRDEFQLSVDNNTLTVKVGTEDSEGYEQRVVSREYMFKSFTRNWTLPENANSDSISARYEAGILLIDVPVKNEQHVARLISVD